MSWADKILRFVAWPEDRQLSKSNKEEASFFAESITVGLPRSGTNYLQYILRGACNLSAKSIYSGKQSSNLKSHALSFEFLINEIEIFNLKLVDEPKVILLLRDPRDAMISFYEFFLSRNQGVVSQDDFLCLDWFLAYSIGTAKTDMRKTHLFPLTVSEAVNQFAVNWLDKSPHLKYQICHVHYEQIVRPEKMVNELLRMGFLGVDADIGFAKTKVEELSRTMVSQYSNEEGRGRGKAFGFRDAEIYSKYRRLIHQVENRMGSVIESFGYA